MQTLQRVAVLGAGTMGSRIAAHFANAGTPSLLLDVPSTDGDRNQAAKRGLENALKQRPGAFFTEADAALVEVGNFDDDLSRVVECQWVIEAVTEDLEIKRALWARVEEHRAPDAILSTNTSGIRLADISRDFPATFKRRFLGTHFFNPPRYLHLLEVVPCPETDKHVVEFVKEFGERNLGKGIVICKDTPNFIANRIGGFYSAAVQRATVEGDYTIEEVDALTGPLIGIPKSASFRLIDVIGLDVWTQVARNVYTTVADEWSDWFRPAPYVEKMLENGWLGEKAGKGFYKRVGPEKQIHALDWKTFEYHPVQTPKFESVEAVRKVPDLGSRVRKLLEASDRASAFLWRVLASVFAYSAAMIPEIADRIVEIDRAMRWGFGHKLGPFELWDAIGFGYVMKRMQDERYELPGSIKRMLSAGASSFYRPGEYFDLVNASYAHLESRPGVLILADVKRVRGEVDKNADASLIDMGDGVLCLEFHSKMNAIGEDTLHMTMRGVELLKGDFEAMIIANEGENFSVGANLQMLLAAAESSHFEAIETYIRHFQKAMLHIKYAPKAIVSAVFARALGGGCEVVLQSCRVQALAELNIGLVEVNVGLIPAAGGTKEMALRFADPVKGLDIIAQARISNSASEAKQLGFLQPADRISMNPELLIGDAKRFALELSKSYQSGEPQTEVVVSGGLGYDRMRQAIYAKKLSGEITEHDSTILERAAHVLSGGRVATGKTVSEQQLLDLEREAFLSLCAMPKSQERIRYMLKNGKPLRN